ncbi:MAG TPA: protein kinase [Bryobacteraceae bacterium]|nr:protein kinase [Bryobacteraceae bacterium]
MRFVPGDTVGPYRVTEVIGEGAAGVVYRVVNSVTGRLEAMKILADGYTHDLEQAQRFLREIQLQAKLDHPNIAQVRTAFCDGTTIVLIMELVDGEPLSSILQRGRIPLLVAVRLAEQVLHALAVAHHQGVIHRDVKPANILVNRNGMVKLTDFGLAKQQGEPGQTGQGMAVGTVYYMAPEQVRGLAATDWRCDLYATGVVLYEMLTGHRPFEGPDQYSVMRAQIEQTAPPLAHWTPELPKGCQTLLDRALQKDPALRFPSAGAFLASLQALREAPLPPRPRPTWRYAGASAGIACLLLAAFAMPPLPASFPLDTPALPMPPAPPVPPEGYRFESGQHGSPGQVSHPLLPAATEHHETALPTRTPRPQPAPPFRATRMVSSEPIRLNDAPPLPLRPAETAAPVLPAPPKVLIEQLAPPAAMPGITPSLPVEKPTNWMRRGLNRVPKLFRRREPQQDAEPAKKD